MAAPARMFGEGEDADVGGVGAEVGVVGAVPQEHCISNYFPLVVPQFKIKSTIPFAFPLIQNMDGNQRNGY